MATSLLQEHKSIKNFTFKFEFLLSKSLQNVKIIQIFRTVHHHLFCEEILEHLNAKQHPQEEHMGTEDQACVVDDFWNEKCISISND